MIIRRTRILALVAALTGVALLTACTPRLDVSRDGDVVDGLVYREVDGERLELDVCRSEADRSTPAPAILVIHGGGFVAGGRAQPNIRQLCLDLAEAGYVAFSIDYRLAPEAVYPAQLEDAQAAVAWMRDPEQVARFDIDPRRIAVLGGSAGAVLAGTLAVTGEGALDEGSRVAAAVSLSGAMTFTSDDPAIRDYVEGRGPAPYLGCPEPTLTACPIAAEAEPIAHVDPTDPPFYLLTSEGERLPEESAELMAAALETAGIPAVVHTEPGSRHASGAVTPEIWAEILDFLDTYV